MSSTRLGGGADRGRPEGFGGPDGLGGDNAAMESSLRPQHHNVLGRRRWSARDELSHAFLFRIEHTDNRRLGQRALGGLTPVESELAFTEQGVQPRQDQSQPPSTEVAAGPRFAPGRLVWHFTQWWAQPPLARRRHPPAQIDQLRR